MPHDRSCSIGSLLRSLVICSSSEDGEQSSSGDFRPYGRGGAARKKPKLATETKTARTTKEPEVVLIRGYGRGGAARKQPKGAAKAARVDLLEENQSQLEGQERAGELEPRHGASIKESAKAEHAAEVPSYPVMPMRVYVSNIASQAILSSQILSRNRIRMILRRFRVHHRLVRRLHRILVVHICITPRSILMFKMDTTRILL